MSRADGPQISLYLPQLMMSFDTILDRVQLAEEVELHGVWFMDHLAAPMRRDADTFEGWTLMAAVAARTERIRMGLLTGCDAFRHPAVLAKQAATVDVISGGRLDLGIGWGSVPAELRDYGIGEAPNARRAARLRDTLEAFEALCSGEPVTRSWDTLELRDAVCRPTPVHGRIPVHVGGGGPQLTMPIVRDHADWWNCPSYAVDRLAELVPLAGDARISVARPIGLVLDGDDPKQVRATAERRFGPWGGLVVGTPAEVAEVLATDVELGVELFAIQLADFGTLRSIEALATEVAPVLRSA